MGWAVVLSTARRSSTGKEYVDKILLATELP